MADAVTSSPALDVYTVSIFCVLNTKYSGTSRDHRLKPLWLISFPQQLRVSFHQRKEKRERKEAKNEGRGCPKGPQPNTSAHTGSSGV